MTDKTDRKTPITDHYRVEFKRGKQTLDDLAAYLLYEFEQEELRLRAAESRLAGERERVIEECAKVCEQIWKDAPNDRASGFEQNAISHGCIASAKAIRALAAQPKEKP